MGWVGSELVGECVHDFKDGGHRNVDTLGCSFSSTEPFKIVNTVFSYSLHRPGPPTLSPTLLILSWFLTGLVVELEHLKDKDEVNKREVYECEG